MTKKVDVKPLNGLENFRPVDAARYLGVEMQTLARWRCEKKKGPQFVKVSHRCVIYRKSDLDAWLQAQIDGVAA